MYQDWEPVVFTKPKPKKQTSHIPKGPPKEYTIINKALPLALQQARMGKNLKQVDLAKMLNIDSKVLNSWEQGKSLPDNNVIANMSKHLGIKLPRNERIEKSEEL